MSDIAPVKVGLLADYVEGADRIDPTVLNALRMTFEEFHEAGTIERPVELVLRAVQGLPNGSFRAVRDAFYELVEEDCVVIFGPYVSENGVPLARYVQELAEVAVITMAGNESMLGEWVFALNNGSMEEEPIIMAAVCRHDGHRSVGIAYEQSLIGQQYLAIARRAYIDAGLRITGEVAIPQVTSEKRAAMEELHAGDPDALVHVGFGLGLLGMNDALAAIGWDPARYTTTAFEFAHGSEMWMRQLTNWIGLDSFDERNEVGRAFLDRYEARFGTRPEYFMPVYCYDMARMIALAIAGAAPLTGEGVKDALEHIKMLPAASGAPGTYLRFGRFIRQGWVGAEYLVARRVLPDASATVFHGTISGTVGSAKARP
ncbi:MAG TPA: ABC transporter substrate-binding protein [Acidimicrobiia bacterium]|nr:ABC transporter substrate-binding protein [Acidimicrobiia bacterium]